MNSIMKWFLNLGTTTIVPENDKETSDIYDYVSDETFTHSEEWLADKKSKGWELMEQTDESRMIGKSFSKLNGYKFRRLKTLRPEKDYTVETLEKDEPQFEKGQKVYVTYHNVWKGFVNVFHPPQSGIIVDRGSRKTHHFAKGYFDYEKLSGDGKCRWYWVKFPCGTFEIPNCCIKDLAENIKREKEWFEMPHVKEMEKDPEQYEAGQKLKEQLHKAEQFLNH